jgi:hypothetical protein
VTDVEGHLPDGALENKAAVRQRSQSLPLARKVLFQLLQVVPQAVPDEMADAIFFDRELPKAL